MNNYDIIINERLKLPTVRKQIFDILKLDINSTKQAFSPKVKNVFKTLNETEQQKYLKILVGPVNYKQATFILKAQYENII